MMDCTKKSDVLRPCQFGFRQKHKTVDAISIVIEEIRSGLDGKTTSCCVFLDLESI